MTRILLLETDKVLARNTIAVLIDAGFEVDWQVDPQEAIAAMDQNQPDLIVTDLILGNHSGIEFLYELRSYPDWRDLPVVLHSSVPPREVYACVSGLEQLEIKAYRYKPATLLSELVGSVQACLQPVYL